jgi:hypothetical protein
VNGRIQHLDSVIMDVTSASGGLHIDHRAFDERTV